MWGWGGVTRGGAPAKQEPSAGGGGASKARVSVLPEARAGQPVAMDPDQARPAQGAFRADAGKRPIDLFRPPLIANRLLED